MSQRSSLIAAVDAALAAGLDVVILTSPPGVSAEPRPMSSAGAERIDLPLSPMQSHVLTGFAVGHSLAHIAQTAGISRTSVATHLKRVRSKLNSAGVPARNRADLHAAARAMGLLP